MFRLDRVRSVQFLAETFERAEHFDCREYILKQLATIPATWSIEVEFQAELYAVQRKIPASHGRLTATSGGVLWHTHHVHLPEMARYLIGLDLPFVIHQPAELRETLRQLAEQLMQIACAGQGRE
jgi:predicted DNA-binding transcriptional regulator YafY